MLGIKHSEAGTTVLQRNQRYMHISAWGYDCYNMDIHSLNDMRLLIDTIKTMGRIMGNGWTLELKANIMKLF